MGILQADLDWHLKSIRHSGRNHTKSASVKEKTPPALDVLKIALERHAGASSVLQKEASESDYRNLYMLHMAVEGSYDECARIGKRPEADELLGKFSGWDYLRGRPKKDGDLTPLPAPDPDPDADDE